MARPNTRISNLIDRAQKEARRAIERAKCTEADLDHALEAFPTDEYNDFFGACREAGNSTERCGALWAVLKERGEVPTGDTTQRMKTNGNPGDTHNPDSGAAGGGLGARGSPGTVDELEQTFRQADQVYLITTTGCPDCQQAKEALKTWIDQGIVEVLNIQESDLGADIVIELGIDATPELVMEHDGERQVV